MLTETTRQWFLQPFGLLDRKGMRVALTLLLIVLSTLFILVYNPLDIQKIQFDNWINRLLPISVSGIIGSVVIFISQYFIRTWCRKDNFTRAEYIKWVLFEFSLLILVFYIIYGVKSEPFLPEVLVTAKFTVLIAMLPYGISLLVLTLYLQSTANQGRTHGESADWATSFVAIKDENDKLNVSVLRKNLIYLRAKDNYVEVGFEAMGKLKKTLVRRSLSSLTKEIAYSQLLRIHRSYTINIDHISHVKRRNNKLELHLNLVPDFVFSTSQTYREGLEDALNNMSK